MQAKRLLVVLLSLTITILIYAIKYDFFHESQQGLYHHALPDKSIQPLGSNKTIFYIVVVACEDRLQETMVMIKSALIYNHPKELLKFVIFTEDNLRNEFYEKLTDWQNLLPQEFEFDIRPLSFPQHSAKEWKSLFKPCASQRLFLPSLLTDIDSVIYVDTDVLFFSPVTDIWHHFSLFNSSHIAGMSPEHLDASIGWYNKFARHPFYGKLGLNSGVMLMNLTRMRKFNWEAHVLPIYKEYKLQLVWADQDMINILFHYHSEKLYLLSCEYNYRSDHCMFMNVCDAHNGIKIVHGNRECFHSSNEPLFKVVYDAVASYQLTSSAYNNFLMPLREALEAPEILESPCGNVSKNILSVAQSLFFNEYT